MTVDDLREFLLHTNLPGDAEVLLDGEHSFHCCEVEEISVSPTNQYGQAQSDALGTYDTMALVFFDRSKG